MKRAAASSAIVAGGFFVTVLWLAGASWAIVFVAFIGVLTGFIAAWPMLEHLLDEARSATSTDAQIDAMIHDPYAFAKSVADLFRDVIDDEEISGDRLGGVMLGATHLSAALEEIVRIGQIRRQEELLRSRIWHP